MARRFGTARGSVARSTVRIIGGRLRGRKITYDGDASVVRPMKDRTREALFNRLGEAVAGTHAIDLFAGTGALGFEAISRGAARLTAIEYHRPTARSLQENADQLGLCEACQFVVADALRWPFPVDDPLPWTLFCCPPYRLYAERSDAMEELLASAVAHAPAGSRLVVEAPLEWPADELPAAIQWDRHRYPPAMLYLAKQV